MNIPKAIEILNSYQAGYLMDKTPDLRDALKLGIEALKRLEHFREVAGGLYSSLLPRETED